MARKKKKINIEDEIKFDEELDDDTYENYNVHDLEDMVNEIVEKEPDECVTIDQLHIVVEWIKNLL